MKSTGITVALCLLLCLAGCGGDNGGSDSPGPTPTPTPTDPPTTTGPGRGFPEAAPWVSFYGSAPQMGDLSKVATAFRVINIDADPDTGNFTPDQITTLKNGGRNRVISYLNFGSMESFRSYWKSAPDGFLSGKANIAAQLGSYSGYPDEKWMNPANPAYQHLILDYVAPRLVAQGVDGFFLDNMEIVEHTSDESNGPCDDACRQGGLDLVRRLREKYPNHLIVMQNATGEVTRTGTTGGVDYPTVLDGISHEEVYAPEPNAEYEAELKRWRAMSLAPGGHSFWVATEDYVGSCGNTSAAQPIYDKSRSLGFSPYATDESAGQMGICYWPF